MTVLTRHHRIIAESLPSYQISSLILRPRVGKQGWTLRDVLGDMQVLLYLCNYMDLEDLSRICASVVDLDVPVGEGDELVIRSIAGMVM